MAGIVADGFQLRGRGLIQVGLLLLIATPVLRVAIAAVAFALQRDHLYLAVSLIVLASLAYSMLIGIPQRKSRYASRRGRIRPRPQTVKPTSISTLERQKSQPVHKSRPNSTMNMSPRGN